MTRPLAPPPKKNPQARTQAPTLPPGTRSRAALGLTVAAAEGRLALQTCAECGTVQYPPRDACHRCLSVDLPWRDVAPGATLLAETTVRTSPNLYFRERAPWRTGTVRLDCGPVAIVHVHGDCARGGRVTILNKLDRAGQGVLIAVPEQGAPHMADDPELRSLTADPKHRRILITDARNPVAPALVQALRGAGAASITLGEAETWRPYPGRAALEGCDLQPLDVTDAASCRRMAAEYGGKVDILINTARFVRPGGVLTREGTAFARDEMEVNALGLMRLAQAFGPGMCARTADGVNAAVAWVNILDASALANAPDYGCFGASQAAAHAISQSLRAEFRAAGLRVMHLFTGPTDDDWFQTVPPPKVGHKALARDLVRGLQEGLEDVYCGDVARDLRDRLAADPRIAARERLGGTT